MRLRNRLTAIIVTLFVFFSLNSNTVNAQIKSSLAQNLHITPTKNEDGHYNILFITTDQERYFQEYRKALLTKPESC